LNPDWQISAGELFELTRPASFALSALASTWVLASSRRQAFPVYAVAAWTLGTLFYPLIILPVYLIVRFARRRPQQQQQRAAQLIERQEDNNAPTVEPTLEPTTEPAQTAPQLRPRLRRTLPLLYLLAVLFIAALFYYRDAQSIDAHLSRANQSRLLGQHDKTIKEYQAALKLEENAHTRNLLGIELVAAGQLEEALAEFRTAERGNEPDDQLPYRIAVTLDALNRSAEAVPEYQRFLGTRRCTVESYPDPQCTAARARVSSKP
jgi:hypothetical protein